MKLDAKHTILTLRGTPSEFADIVGFPDYDTLEELKSVVGCITEDTRVVALLSREPWELSGTWKAFTESIGYPEASSKEELLDAFQHLHPSVTIER